MAKKYVESGLFVSIQFPFNFIETDAAKELHPLPGKGVAILAMKPFAGGAITEAALAFKYLRSHGNLFPIPGYDSAESVEQIVSFYGKPNEVTADDLTAMEAVRNELGGRSAAAASTASPARRESPSPRA